MEDLITKLAAQFDAIKTASLPFLVALVLAAGAIWLIVNYTYSGLLSSKNAQLELANRQLADYKQKLSGASPEEAKAKIEALERRISQLEPRRLTPSQRQTLVESLRSSDRTTQRILISHEGGCLIVLNMLQSLSAPSRMVVGPL